MNLYQELAEAKTRGSNDGDFFNPDQQGSLVIHKIVDHVKASKRTVILVGEILESNAKTPEAIVQKPGTKVKRIYQLSVHQWHIDELKTDLVRIIGIDEKSMSANDIGEMFKEVFENQMLTGVVTNFNTKSKVRPGKQTLTDIYFSEPAGDINAPEKVTERKKAIDGK